MQKSRLPQGGQNLFQTIKARTSAAEQAGKKIWKLTIGQPSGPALESARINAADAVMSRQEEMHEYQDNGSPGVPEFAHDFVGLHQKKSLTGRVAYLPIPGIKPMLPLIPMACGSICQDNRFHFENVVATMTNPGYPVPQTWCDYLAVENYPLQITPENNFLFEVEGIQFYTNLLMLNYPHNPTGQVATRAFWQKICQHCSDHKIRIFNDAAYAILVFHNIALNKEVCTLAEVAQDYPELSWAEAYSASKVIGNGTGWRVGAMVGSPDFIGDIAIIKGNTDSGFFAPAAYGVLNCMQSDTGSIMRIRDTYEYRVTFLTTILQSRGMKIAVSPGAGFFTLWQAPKKAFGQPIKDAEEFNYLMIDKTGVAGVHFGPYIRYAVTSPIEDASWRKAICSAFDQAEVEY